jgi:hypothetical protein
MQRAFVILIMAAQSFMPFILQRVNETPLMRVTVAGAHLAPGMPLRNLFMTRLTK